MCAVHDLNERMVYATMNLQMRGTLSLYQRLSKFPFGNTIFSWGVSLRAPYFASIHPLIIDLRPGYCRVRIRDRRSIRNHIGSIHAGAMCTLSELVGEGWVRSADVDGLIEALMRGNAHRIFSYKETLQHWR